MIIRYHGTPSVAIALCLFFPVLFGLELRMNPTASSSMPTYFARDIYYLWQSKHSAVVYAFWICSNLLSEDTGWSITELNNTFSLRAVFIIKCYSLVVSGLVETILTIRLLFLMILLPPWPFIELFGLPVIFMNKSSRLTCERNKLMISSLSHACY